MRSCPPAASQPRPRPPANTCRTWGLTGWRPRPVRLRRAARAAPRPWLGAMMRARPANGSRGVGPAKESGLRPAARGPALARSKSKRPRAWRGSPKCLNRLKPSYRGAIWRVKAESKAGSSGWAWAAVARDNARSTPTLQPSMCRGAGVPGTERHPPSSAPAAATPDALIRSSAVRSISWPARSQSAALTDPNRWHHPIAKGRGRHTMADGKQVV